MGQRRREYGGGKDGSDDDDDVGDDDEDGLVAYSTLLVVHASAYFPVRHIIIHTRPTLAVQTLFTSQTISLISPSLHEL